ncbi:pyridoxine 5'-phosphate synthase [Candidatus Riesia pediculicola]|uniref:Pyridoxine 5'-phosphate synthase n=1 Tax=Riesia pediculicola (strain USDA) TaxID=515618 RepID=D4G8B8_RIEPU|nr:pyridoxine 5'-phosphate synthase [Candidatus Riesia pediculicola]ADD79592.1 pyridoxal phosphate biosynthetic protein PdxJ [Candidatus Riesia pediculicola USDA]ARC53812.1 pyridoxine 5'-phosphate synthase [Candidatus Riesia pediculicola]QOJ86445.1 pyridoxine 5'-phosphate synthase [Candidatus Riesia pediculicola]
MKKIYLGVNVDHVATIRNRRMERYPDPVRFAILAEEYGVDSITVHLREDQRHITENDVHRLSQVLQTRMNLEMSISKKIVNFARIVKPNSCCLVPERREEITTEGGLNVYHQKDEVREVVEKLKSSGIVVSLFIEPKRDQIDASIEAGADAVEFHTGFYSNSRNLHESQEELRKIISSATYARSKGLIVNAGHGLTYQNVFDIAKIYEIHELNIGYSIVSRSLFVGLKNAIKEMKRILHEARKRNVNNRSGC